LRVSSVIGHVHVKHDTQKLNDNSSLFRIISLHYCFVSCHICPSCCTPFGIYRSFSSAWLFYLIFIVWMCMLHICLKLKRGHWQGW